jgi:hypothetical protein
MLEMLEGISVSEAAGFALGVQWIFSIVKLRPLLRVCENFLGCCDINELFLCDFSFAFILGKVIRMPVGNSNYQ